MRKSEHNTPKLSLHDLHFSLQHPAFDLEYYRGNQTCVRQGKSTTDQLFVVKQILNKFWEHDMEVHNIFLFLNRCTTLLIEINYIAYSIASKYVRLIQSNDGFNNSDHSRIKRTNQQLSNSQGTKQGNEMALTLFNLTLDYVNRQLNVGRTNLLTNLCRRRHVTLS